MRLVPSFRLESRSALPWFIAAFLVATTTTVSAQETDSPAADPSATNSVTGSEISGRWSRTWVRHDTDDVGGFELVVGERDGRPFTTFLGQEATALSTSATSVAMKLEPASECVGADLRFSFHAGEPVGGTYTTYGGCSRSGTYIFSDISTNDASGQTCPPFASRPGLIVRDCQVVIYTPPDGSLELTRMDPATLGPRPHRDRRRDGDLHRIS